VSICCATLLLSQLVGPACVQARSSNPRGRACGLEMCTEMGMAGIPRNPRETHGDGDKVEKSCGNPAEMEVSLAGFPRG